MSANDYSERFIQYEYHEAKNPSAAEQNALGKDGWFLSQVIKGDTASKDRWIYARVVRQQRIKPMELKAAQPAGVWTIGPAVDIATTGTDTNGRK